MWLNSQESIKKSLLKNKAKLIGNIPLYDRTNNQISAMTILYWMLTTKKNKMLGIFPKPGVSDVDIQNIEKQGEILNNSIYDNSFEALQNKFIEKIPINIPNDILFVELRARKLFNAWAKLIKSKTKSRKLWVNIYKYYLLIALFIIAPIVIFFVSILIFPFTKSSIKKKKEYFCSLDLK